MSVLLDQDRRMTEAEYLAFERASEHKHEYLNGEVFAMAGASERHVLICASVMFALYGQFRGRCRVYVNDMRVKVRPSGLYTYPDITVVCGHPQLEDNQLDTLLNPMLIVKVLSPSTESYDRGKKFQHYREIESLQEYVLISQDSPRIEHYVRQDHQFWQFTDAKGLDSSIDLPSIGCTLRLADVYEQVSFDSSEPPSDTPATYTAP